MDLPYDELYHKQKQVIAEVIEAEKALKAKEDSLPDPFASQMLDTSKLSAEQFGQVASLLESFQSPFQVSQRKRKEALLAEKLKQIEDGENAGAYKFNYSETADFEQKAALGLISKRQAQQIQQLMQESGDVNLGYAFVTFSHADEARLYLLENEDPYYGSDQLDVFLKSRIDHSHLDMEYFMAHARNEAKTVDELVAVREARQRLRDFEKEMDKQLPSRKRLQKFRRFA